MCKKWIVVAASMGVLALSATVSAETGAEYVPSKITTSYYNDSQWEKRTVIADTYQKGRRTKRVRTYASGGSKTIWKYAYGKNKVTVTAAGGSEKETYTYKKGVLQKYTYSQDGYSTRVYKYEYDKKGRLTKETESWGNVSKTFKYKYDKKGNLKTWTESPLWGSGTITHTYTFDKYGNVKTQVIRVKNSSRGDYSEYYRYKNSYSGGRLSSTIVSVSDNGKKYRKSEMFEYAKYKKQTFRLGVRPSYCKEAVFAGG